MKTLSQILRLLVLTSLMATAQAQEISIPDSGLNAAIREALQKPAGPLTAQDLLGLTNLYAALLDRMGAHPRSIGDSTGEVEHLSDI